MTTSCTKSYVLTVALVCAVAGTLTAQADVPPESSRGSERTLATVNGAKITAGDLAFMMLTRKVPADLQPKVRERFLEQLIDSRLIQAYLDKRKIKAAPLAIDAQVDRINRLIKQKQDDPQKVLSALGYTDETLRRELALPLAWRAYVEQIVTAKTLREYWDRHRSEFDGTQIRASHIMIGLGKNDGEAARQAAREKLTRVRENIIAGRQTFADAAREYSTAPSRENGGDLGRFRFGEKNLQAFSDAAFPLQIGEVSEPFATPFGIHICTVTERNPGQLSLEDVRLAVLSRLSQEIWDKLVEQERLQAKIERMPSP